MRVGVNVLFLLALLASPAQAAILWGIESQDGRSVKGWACDNSAPGTPIRIDFYRDNTYSGGGTYVNSVTAKSPRGAGIGSFCGDAGFHGFEYEFPTSPLNLTAFPLYPHALAANGASHVVLPVQQMPAVIVLGKVERVDADGYINGWAVDTTSVTTGLYLNAYVDAPYYPGATLQAYGYTDIPRLDVNSELAPFFPTISGNHGFRFRLPAPYYWDSLPHSVYVYGFNSAGTTNNLLNGLGTAYQLPQAWHPDVILTQYPMGWVEKITADGTITGWAADGRSPTTSLNVKIYVDGAPGMSPPGTLIATVPANLGSSAVNVQVGINQTTPMSGNHRFAFTLPSPYRTSSTNHRWYVQAVDSITGGAYSQVLYGPNCNPTCTQGVDYASTLPANWTPTTYRTNHTCETSDCLSSTYDYQSASYPGITGWNANGTNYFTKWNCTSSTGINYISRLNIAPLGHHSPNFWKDSTYVNLARYEGGNPVIYFSAGRKNTQGTFSLKKAMYSAAQGKWNIYDILDAPFTPTGISSMDGRDAPIHYIMNDYSLPGWGPTANLPGGVSKIPGVATTSANPEIPSYELQGSGPLGLTTIRNLIQQPSWGGDRTCIFMNPKLFDYDANNVPRAMTTFLGKFKGTAWQWAPCSLPPGAPISMLPMAGNYIFRYNATTGWQLDLSVGLVEDIGNLDYAYKLMPGSNSVFLRAEWAFGVKKIDFNAPNGQRVATSILNCTGGVTGGEPSGTDTIIYFVANDPDNGPVDPLNILQDIYVAWKNN